MQMDAQTAVAVEIEITLEAVFGSWEDEDRNRYFPLGGGRVAIRDGATGAWRGVTEMRDLRKE